MLNFLQPLYLTAPIINGENLPFADPELLSTEPSPTDQGAVLAFLKAYAPDTWQEMPVNFYQTYMPTESYGVAFPSGGDASLLPGFDVELWELPLSRPSVNVSNHNFVYQWFQRGILM